MTQIHLIPAAACHMAAACALYNEAFPPEERRPWDTIVNPVSAAGPHLYIAADADVGVAGRFAFRTCACRRFRVRSSRM